MKAKIKKQTIYYLISLFVIYFLSLSIVFKPSIAEISPYKIINLELVRFLIYLSYPIYFLSLFSFLKIKDNQTPNKLVVFFTLLLSFLIIFFNYLFIFIESIKYPNFIYSQYHIYLPYLNGFSNIQIFIFIITASIYTKKIDVGSFFSFRKVKVIFKKFEKPQLLIYFVSIVVVSSFIQPYIKLLIYESSLIPKEFDNSVEYKIRTVDLWDVAVKSNLIIKVLPESSVVFIPPQTWDFPEIGNQVLARYYLYPRTLVSPGKVDAFLSEHPVCDVYYIVLEKGRFKSQFFPEENFRFKKITLFKKNGNIDFVENGMYDSDFRSSIKELNIGVLERNLCN